MIILHFHLQLQFKYELFHILHIKHIFIIFFVRALVAGNMVPRVFLFSVAILGNEKPWGRGWRRQFDV